jgi:hypothetical protein
VVETLTAKKRGGNSRKGLEDAQIFRILNWSFQNYRNSEAGGAGGGGAHFWGVDAEAEMGEVGLAERH